MGRSVSSPVSRLMHAILDSSKGAGGFRPTVDPTFSVLLRRKAMRCVPSVFEFTLVHLQQQDLLGHDGTDGDITEAALNPKVARSRLARPTNPRLVKGYSHMSTVSTRLALASRIGGLREMFDRFRDPPTDLNGRGVAYRRTALDG